MLDILQKIESQLPKLLNSAEWKSVFVDYHKPYVERLWTNITINDKNYRIYLHKILNCNFDEALYHPHPWPSVMKILSGSYKMNIGFGSGMIAPVVASTLILPTGSYYEMVEEDSWHCVAPINSPSYSLMISGEPWNRESHKSTKQLFPLSKDKELEILNFFKSIYK